MFVSRLAGRFDRRLERWGIRRLFTRSARVSPSAIRWTRCRGLTWVATLSNQFMGMVEVVDGAYVANDTVGGTYNTYRTLAEAMQAFEPRFRPPTSR